MSLYTFTVNMFYLCYFYPDIICEDDRISLWCLMYLLHQELKSGFYGGTASARPPVRDSQCETASARQRVRDSQCETASARLPLPPMEIFRGILVLWAPKHRHDLWGPHPVLCPTRGEGGQEWGTGHKSPPPTAGEYLSSPDSITPAALHTHTHTPGHHVHTRTHTHQYNVHKRTHRVHTHTHSVHTQAHLHACTDHAYTHRTHTHIRRVHTHIRLVHTHAHSVHTRAHTVLTRTLHCWHAQPPTQRTNVFTQPVIDVHSALQVIRLWIVTY